MPAFTDGANMICDFVFSAHKDRTTETRCRMSSVRVPANCNVYPIPNGMGFVQNRATCPCCGQGVLVHEIEVSVPWPGASE